MDKPDLLDIISKKVSVFGASQLGLFNFPMLNETFAIVHTINKVDGGHWIMLVRLNDPNFGNYLKATRLQHYLQLKRHMPPAQTFLTVNAKRLQR